MNANCPTCNNEIDIPLEADGMNVECPYCNAKFFCSGGTLYPPIKRSHMQTRKPPVGMDRPLCASIAMWIVYPIAAVLCGSAALSLVSCIIIPFYESVDQAFWLMLVGSIICGLTGYFEVCLARGYRYGKPGAARLSDFLYFVYVILIIILCINAGSVSVIGVNGFISLAIYSLLFCLNRRGDMKKWLDAGYIANQAVDNFFKTAFGNNGGLECRSSARTKEHIINNAVSDGRQGQHEIPALNVRRKSIEGTACDHDMVGSAIEKSLTSGIDQSDSSSAGGIAHESNMVIAKARWRMVCEWIRNHPRTFWGVVIGTILLLCVVMYFYTNRYIVIGGSDGIVYRTDRITGETVMIRGTTMRVVQPKW